MRFQDRLITEFAIEPETLAAQIPNLLLQPLVENALKHGLANKTQDGRLEIRSGKMESAGAAPELWLRVMDNGAGFEPTETVNNRQGLGLLNVKERLQRHYLDSYSFELSTSPGAGCTIDIRIPLIVKHHAD